MKVTMKRLLSTLLAAAMALTLLPGAAFAEEAPGMTPPAACTKTEGCTLADGHEGECTLPDAPEDGQPTPAACTKTEGCTLAEGHEGECALPGAPEDGQPAPAACTKTEGCTLAEGHEGECALPGTVFAQAAPAAETASGELENGFHWSLSDGTLTITGTGEMPDFSDTDEGNSSKAPWNSLSEEINNVILSEGVTQIGAYSFYGCANLTGAQLPTTLESIKEYAFSGCKSLALIKLPDGLKTIERFAFLNCDALKELTLPAGLESMGYYVFQNCDILSTLTFLGTKAPTIHVNTFGNATALDAIYIPENATGYDAEGWPQDKLRGPIGSGDFGEGFHWSLSGDGTLTITGTGDMPNFDLGGAVGAPSMPWREYKDNIQKLVLSGGITSVGNYAFYMCGNLASAELPAGLRSIGEYAFYDCDTLALTYLPDSVESIGNRAFYDCYALALTKLPDSLKTIGYFTFGFCDGLKELTLPAGLESMGFYVFQGCNNLTSLTFLGTNAPAIDVDTFENATALNAIYVPENATGYDAAGWPQDKVLYPVTVQTAGGGTASASHAYAAADAQVLLTAAPEEGRHLREWQVSAGGVTVQDDKFTMPAASVTVTAVFESHAFNQQTVASQYLASAADCDSPAAYYKSCVCGAKGTETFTVGTENGHDWGEPVWNWSDDGKSATVTFTCNNDNTHTQSPAVTVTSKVKTPATCTEKGTTTYTATVTLDGKQYTSTKDVVDIAKLNHTLKKTDKVEATCTTDGKEAYYTCESCGKHFSDEEGKNEIAKLEEYGLIPATKHKAGTEWKHNETGHWNECMNNCGEKLNEAAHQFGGWTVTKEATKTEAGSREKSCTACGYTVTESIPATGTGTGGGTATTPTDPPKPSPETNAGSGSPQTGDPFSAWPFVGLLFISAAGLVTLLAVCAKRRKDAE